MKPHKSGKYLVFWDGQKGVYIHRYTWEQHNGPIPEGMLVDHVDGNVLNNNIENLRLATWSENNCNKICYKNNAIGIKGIYYEPKKKLFVAGIQKDRKRYKKRSRNIEIVIAWREKMGKTLHGEFYHE